MLLAIVTWVRASRWLSASPLPRPSSLPPRSTAPARGASGTRPDSRGSAGRSRETNTGVSGGCPSTNALERVGERRGRQPARLQEPLGPVVGRLDLLETRIHRSAIRRMFSTSPSRSMVGTAHSSPMLSGADLLELADEEVRCSRDRGAPRCGRSARWRPRRRGDSRRAVPRRAWAAPRSSRAAGSAGFPGCVPGRRRNCPGAIRRRS